MRFSMKPSMIGYIPFIWMQWEEDDPTILAIGKGQLSRCDVQLTGRLIPSLKPCQNLPQVHKSLFSQYEIKALHRFLVDISGPLTWAFLLQTGWLYQLSYHAGEYTTCHVPRWWENGMTMVIDEANLRRISWIDDHFEKCHGHFDPIEPYFSQWFFDKNYADVSLMICLRRM